MFINHSRNSSYFALGVINSESVAAVAGNTLLQGNIDVRVEPDGNLFTDTKVFTIGRIELCGNHTEAVFTLTRDVPPGATVFLAFSTIPAHNPNTINIIDTKNNTYINQLSEGSAFFFRGFTNNQLVIGDIITIEYDQTMMSTVCVLFYVRGLEDADFFDGLGASLNVGSVGPINSPLDALVIGIVYIFNSTSDNAFVQDPNFATIDDARIDCEGIIRRSVPSFREFLGGGPVSYDPDLETGSRRLTVASYSPVVNTLQGDVDVRIEPTGTLRIIISADTGNRLLFLEDVTPRRFLASPLRVG